jgi:hypothetical protein
MSVRRLLVLSSLVLGVAALSPAATLGAANGTDRPLRGAVSATTTVNVATGAVTENASGELSHLGAVTIHVDGRSSRTGNSIAGSGTSTLTAANGDQLFATFTSTGTFTSRTTIELTFVVTIIGGTGRFADASGMFTISASSVVVSIVGPNVTTQDSGTFEGQISY